MSGFPGFPFGDPESFADAPLFRELQRVMSASHGPVNWELARQVAVAGANGEGGPDPEPGEGEVTSLRDAVRIAELQVAGFTGLDAPTDVAVVEGVRRATWIQRNVEGLRPLIEPAATRIGEAVTRAQTEALPDMGSAEQLMPGLSQLMGQMSPLLLGAQVGTVFGSLAQEALGRYDIALPRADGAHTLSFVVANIAAFERDWSLDPTEFRTWVAMHEVTHRFEFSRPWLFGHLRSLLDDYLSTLRFDIEGMQRRLEGIDASNPEAIQEVLGSEEGLFGTVMDDEQRLKLRRIQAFMAAVEGYADHVVHAVGGRLLRSASRIEEAMLRYREGERVDPVLERMLGVEVERDRYRQGKAFCDAVAEATDESTLSRMWDDAEALPSLPEIEEPQLWLARTV